MCDQCNMKTHKAITQVRGLCDKGVTNVTRYSASLVT